MEEETTKRTPPATPEEIVALCEQVAYDRKAENIVRLDMTDMNAQSDHYIICTGFSEPHIGAIAERIKRDVRTKLGVRPITVDGTPASHWMIVDYGVVMIHVLTDDARKKYELESLWGDAARTDVVAKLDAVAKAKRSAGYQE